MPRPPLSEADLQRTRERTLDAALGLFRDKGIDGVTVRALAQAVELSPMALYRYFPEGRSEVLAAIRGRGFDDLAEHISRALDGVDHPIDRVVACLLAGTDFAMRRAPLYHLMFDVTQPEDADTHLAEQRRHAWQVVQQAFEPALDTGMLRGDRELLPHIFFAAFHGMIQFEHSLQPHPARRLQRLLAPMLETLLRGTASPSAITRARRRIPALLRKLPRSKGTPP